MGAKTYDFGGWATRNDLKCSDGRTIRKDAFKDNDGQVVPLVWMHQHGEPTNVLGHALLENRPEGVYAYGTFNDTEYGRHAKALVQNGDITALSIYANKLKQQGSNVLHGAIKEVSLVIAGANPGASIDFATLEHSDGSYYTLDDEATIYTGEPITTNVVEHSEEESKMEDNKKAPEEIEHAEGDDKTVKDVWDGMTEEQKNVVYFMLAQVAGDNGADEEDDEDDDEVEHYDEGGNDFMKHNVFEGMEQETNTLSHAETEAIIGDAKRYGSMKESFLAHAQEYGIENIDYLFPEARNVNNGAPEFIKRETGWVQKVMGAVHHTPFSRIKTMFADITEDEARAKGYIKGKLKKEEVFSLLKRTTDPQTIYKKQKMDRDDVIDITDFDVIAWLKSEMRLMLDEEIARAILIGDGRLASDDDKISEDHVRPVVKDADLYNIKVEVDPGTDDDDLAKNFIRAAIKTRKDYRGSGNPTLFCTEDLLADMLLLEDGIGHLLYASESALATVLRVKEIVTVPVMTEQLGVIVNLADYNVGADKGGAVNMFDDFDIDYNQMKYLIETRCSGALIKPYSAMTFTRKQG